MNQKQRYEHYKTKAQEYHDYSVKLEGQIKEALQKLADLSVGATPVGAPKEWDQACRMQWSASRFLLQQASKVCKKPSGFLHP